MISSICSIRPGSRFHDQTLPQENAKITYFAHCKWSSFVDEDFEKFENIPCKQGMDRRRCIAGRHETKSQGIREPPKLNCIPRDPMHENSCQ